MASFSQLYRHFSDVSPGMDIEPRPNRCYTKQFNPQSQLVLILNQYYIVVGNRVGLCQMLHLNAQTWIRTRVGRLQYNTVKLRHNKMRRHPHFHNWPSKHFTVALDEDKLKKRHRHNLSLRRMIIIMSVVAINRCVHA